MAQSSRPELRLLEQSGWSKTSNIPTCTNEKNVRRKANLAYSVVQGREGFVQKYPQSYKDEKALGTHHRQIKERRQAAATRRDQEDTLQIKYATWTKRAELAGNSVSWF
jgi:hypothetical protein